VEIRRAFAGTATKFVLLGTYAFMFGWIGLVFILATLRMSGTARSTESIAAIWATSSPRRPRDDSRGARRREGDRRDLRNNAVAMYFSKAITRTDYLLAKFLTLAGFLLTATLVPAVCLWIGHWAISTSRSRPCSGSPTSGASSSIARDRHAHLPLRPGALLLSRNALVRGSSGS